MNSFILFNLILNFFFFQADNFSLDVHINGFSSNKGKAFVELINEENKPIKQLVLPVENKTVHPKLTNLPKGNYALRVFHDENNNQKLDKNMVGYPTEKWGVSNNIRPSFRGPEFKEMAFQLTKNKEITIEIK